MNHPDRCYHTTAPIALALGGIQRMQDCLGTAFDHRFVSALSARLPGIAEQGRARFPRPRGLPVYDGALECLPHLPTRGPSDGFSLLTSTDLWPTLPTPPRQPIDACAPSLRSSACARGA